MMDAFYSCEKLTSRISELASYRYIHVSQLDEWLVREDTSKEEKYPPQLTSEDQSFSIGDVWRGRDYYLWIQKTCRIPSSGKPLFLFDFGRTGGGYNSGFESLLFIDGQPYQGVDSNHKEVFLDESLFGKTVQVSLKLWSGLEGGGEEQIQTHTFKQALVGELHEEADNLYYLSDILLKTIKQLGENDPVRYQLLEVLNHAFLLIDWSVPGSDDFYQSVCQANSYLVSAVEQMPKDSRVTITAIGHTHIDVAWLWRLKHTREKAARSFSTVLRLMNQYPDYYFLQTQPQLYKFIKEDYPEIYEQIKSRIEEGRWEVDGAMWLESDCNIPSGESLTRQILHGSRFIKEEFGQDVNYLWLPDVFGYSWALPQILKKSGIDTFMTTKISWNQYNRMPHDTFIWRGIDGSEVLTHFITTPEVGAQSDWASRWFYTYNGQIEPETVQGIYNAYRDKNINSHLLLSYGFGDGGGGVTRDMLEKRRHIDKVPGMPFVKTGKAVDYFESLHDTFAKTEQYVHKWDGELYLEYHRGTYTSQAYTKRMNRKTELMLRELEMLYSFKEMTGQNSYPEKELYEAWETLLRNQFHDIIPGSSIKEVYEDHKEEFTRLWHGLDALKQQLTTSHKTSCQFINSTAWRRNVLLELDDNSKEGNFYSETGDLLPLVTTEDSSFLLLEKVAGLSSSSIYFKEEDRKSRNNGFATVGKQSIDTPFYQICWNENGNLTRIYDKEHARDVLNGSGNVLQLFEDKPMNFDAWDIDIYYQEKKTDVRFSDTTVTENNELFADVTSNAAFGQSKLTQKMRVYKHSRRIDFITDVDWREHQRLLKVKFDVNVRSTKALYDIQYGNVERPTHWNTSWDMAKFETVGHQWADLSEHGYGVGLLNDCKYGYDIKDNQMRLSLLKGGIYPDPNADIGKHHFIYSLLPHKGDFIEGKVIEEAWELNATPFLVTDGQEFIPEISIDSSEPVMVSALKKAADGDGWILRINNVTGGKQSIKITSCSKFNLRETNLMEKNTEICYKADTDIELQAYEVKTIRLTK